jgi:predicted MPP superfamily phosphohydrolase
MKRFFKITLTITIIIVCFSTYIYMDNNNIRLQTYKVYSDKLPQNFDGYKIMLVADFHSADYYEKTAQKIIDEKPNIIVIAGDLVNMSDTSFENAMKLVKLVAPVAPIYFTNGNHEEWSKSKSQILVKIEQAGAIVLNNESVQLEYRNSKIALTGFEDTIYSDDAMRYETVEKTLKKLSDIPENKELFNILICHRANLYDTVAKYPFNLVLSGHLHGGQIGIPIIGDYILYKVNKNYKYVKGYYRKGNSQLVVSGGLSKDLKNPRILNPPELVLITLKAIK